MPRRRVTVATISVMAALFVAGAIETAYSQSHMAVVTDRTGRIVRVGDVVGHRVMKMDNGRRYCTDGGGPLTGVTVSGAGRGPEAYEVVLGTDTQCRVYVADIRQLDPNAEDAGSGTGPGSQVAGMTIRKGGGR